MPITKKKLKNNVSDELDSIERSASELREIISQIADGSSKIDDVDTICFAHIDDIKSNLEDISGQFDDLETERDEANERIEELEEEEENELDKEVNTMVGILQYSTNNMRDADIMEEVEKCMATIRPDRFISVLKGLHGQSQPLTPNPKR